ncbi:hypothetical protein [Cupriavidus sp. 8B]
MAFETGVATVAIHARGRVLRRVSECQGERWLVRRLHSLRRSRAGAGEAG